MKSTKKYILFIFLLALSLTSQAQSEVRTYNLTKGHAFDIILLSTKENTKELQKRYFDTAFPIAQKMGYVPLKGFGVKESPLQGNYHPQSMIFGTWPSLGERQKFLDDIEKSVPDFHEMRRDIWSTFYMTYWEVKKDMTFQIDPAKFNTVTAVWTKEGSSIDDYKNNWVKTLNKSKGKNIIELTNGASPFGYDYNPDFMVITEWESREAYEAFRKKSAKLDKGDLKQIHQFII